jgi:L-ascorbate metabolism protein UlaG (beta-lactamase superfamily)
MDRHDAVAAAELIKAGTIVPCHYDTFPPIQTDAEAFQREVKGSDVVILQPGETHSA